MSDRTVYGASGISSAPAGMETNERTIGVTRPTVTATSILSNGSFQLQFKGDAANNTYTVETSTDLVTWVNVGFPTNTPPGSAFYQYIDPHPGQPNRYYKIKAAY